MGTVNSCKKERHKQEIHGKAWLFWKDTFFVLRKEITQQDFDMGHGTARIQPNVRAPSSNNLRTGSADGFEKHHAELNFQLMHSVPQLLSSMCDKLTNVMFAMSPCAVVGDI